MIPAGILIGLGIGLLAGYPASGVLIGLGLGLIAAGIAPCRGDTTEAGAGCTPSRMGKNMILFIIGIVMILLGVGIVYAPVNIWTYIIPLFLILLGVWFVIRALTRME